MISTSFFYQSSHVRFQAILTGHPFSSRFGSRRRIRCGWDAKEKARHLSTFWGGGYRFYCFVAISRSECQSGYVPKDAFDISPLSRSVGIVTRDGIVISDPTKYVIQTVHNSLGKTHPMIALPNPLSLSSRTCILVIRASPY